MTWVGAGAVAIGPSTAPPPPGGSSRAGPSWPSARTPPCSRPRSAPARPGSHLIQASVTEQGAGKETTDDDGSAQPGIGLSRDPGRPATRRGAGTQRPGAGTGRTVRRTARRADRRKPGWRATATGRPGSPAGSLTVPHFLRLDGQWTGAGEQDVGTLHRGRLRIVGQRALALQL